MARDYTKDTIYESTPEQKHKRALRNAARRIMEQQGFVHKGDGKDVDHKHMLKMDGANPTSAVNDEANLRAVTEHTNRSWRKGKHGY